MANTILLAAVAFVVVLVIIVALRPAEFRVARTVRMTAPPATVFAQVNDFKKWEPWNPWTKADPTMKQFYEGQPAGTGAIYRWAGNNKVGEGRMTIIENRPDELVRIKLEFQKPMANICVAEFTFIPDGGQTATTWSMSGKNNFMAKAFHLMINMDKMIGGQFEKGLTQMKSIAESLQ